MKIMRLLVDVVTVFAVSFVVSIIVSLLWSLVVHKTTTIDWETSVRFAILLGIIVPWITSRRGAAR